MPAAFGLTWLALAASLANALLLAVRIRDEERLLLRSEAYRRHFGDKPRFLPRIAGRGDVLEAQGKGEKVARS
jgi:hypothetical protein